MYDVHLRLIGKLVGDFLLVIIELCSLGAFVLSQSTRLTDRRTDRQTGRQNLDSNTVRMLCSRTVKTLCGTVSTYLHTIISFCQDASIWQTDGRTDGQMSIARCNLTKLDAHKNVTWCLNQSNLPSTDATKLAPHVLCTDRCRLLVATLYVHCIYVQRNARVPKETLVN